MTRRAPILVSSDNHELPYSKGVMAAEITATGLSPSRAYEVAEAIEEHLIATERRQLTADALAELATGVIESEVGERYARNFTRWRALGAIDRPLVILIGGTTGVGKSTIATQIASRLGITRVIPTDAIREVMRGMFTTELMPSLHTSSFEAERLVVQPLPKSADKVIIGYREQARAVCVGVDSLISRAINEGTDLIIEGAHACPGYFKEPSPQEAVFVPIVISIGDETLHRSHFAFRSREARDRPQGRYLKYFANIRRIQKYIRKSASSNGVPIVESFELDRTVSECIDLVLDRVAQAVGEGNLESTRRVAPNSG
ncbi:MAG: hypothetical protein DCC49_06635 [Acidobacteria bacterium]|nr:MAG: hypothetical protein DCC49_06635 [Acidobacteriota bacterium]